MYQDNKFAVRLVFSFFAESFVGLSALYILTALIQQKLSFYIAITFGALSVIYPVAMCVYFYWAFRKKGVRINWISGEIFVKSVEFDELRDVVPECVRSVSEGDRTRFYLSPRKSAVEAVLTMVGNGSAKQP